MKQAVILLSQVKWMMYWIVFSLFSATESVLDPLLSFWLPFYNEVKVVLLLYLASPFTRGWNLDEPVLPEEQL